VPGTGGVPPEHEAGVQAVGAGQGEYDLTFPPAQQGMLEGAELLSTAPESCARQPLGGAGAVVTGYADDDIPLP